MKIAQYSRVASLLHWFIGIALLAQISFGFLLDDLAPRGTPSRGVVINVHKSVGIVLVVLILLRLLWRLRHAPPAWPSTLSAVQRRAAHLGHVALYACMLVMPLSGYIASNFSKHGVKFFGLALRPWGADLPAVYSVLNGLHKFTALLFTALIIGHVLMALKHALMDRDGVFQRISPCSNK